MSNQEEINYEEQLAKIRRKRSRQTDNTKIRKFLNAVFLLIAIIGLVMYFADDAHRMRALIVIAVGMLFKVVEFFLRFFN